MNVFRHSGAALAALVGAPALLGAAAVSDRWRVGLRERLGAGDAVAGRPLWVHGASVGEILAAQHLVDALRDKGHAVVASTNTPTGRDVMRRTRPDVPCRIAPLDHPWCVSAALARVDPRALVLIETELWPSFIAGAARRGVPVVLVSARLSDRSFPRYQRIAPLLRRTLARLSAVGARTEVDRERFVALGVPEERVTVSGDLKLELETAPRPLADDLATALPDAPLLVAGSTHPGEEEAALAALSAVEEAGQRALLVLAPRHLERTDDVEAAVRGRGRTLHRRSRLPGRPLAAGEVLLLDTLGELASLYPRAAASFVGGSLVTVGGHNVLEPVAARRPVVYGPHTGNVRHAVEILGECGAGLRVADAAELGAVWASLLLDPAAATARGEAGWREMQRHRGSAARAAQLVVSTLGAR
ncbi:MAG: 3-deoxy-D-manno-octulosonic acid transferase [Myxococcota bacterium]